MKKHKDAIQIIRAEIKLLVEEKPKLREAVRALKFDPEGKRRPETGFERHNLKMAYDNGTRIKIRTRLLAQGLLRGLPHRRIEPKWDPGMMPYLVGGIHTVIQKALGDNEELKLEWTKERVKQALNDVGTVVTEAA